MDKKQAKMFFNLSCLMAAVVLIISIITRQLIINVISFIFIIIADRVHKKFFRCPGCGKPMGSIKRKECPFCGFRYENEDASSEVEQGMK